jgi:hypothetical protein
VGAWGIKPFDDVKNQGNPRETTIILQLQWKV